MRHVIFGGNGFVGRHLAGLLLDRGDEVVICDIARDDLPIYRNARFLKLDITDRGALSEFRFRPDDIVHNLAARLLVPILPRRQRRDYFYSVNFDGAANILAEMKRQGASKLIYFTTDMVYGHTATHPRYEDHPRAPLGPYGDSKLASERLCEEYREQGFNVTIFRPRLIIGPGRLGILEKLFKAIDHSLPVPLIGNGRNFYQFISVYDCASAIVAAVDAGVPNSEYNLGSLNPPTVRDLLGGLIRTAGSRSVLVPTPASLVKLVLEGLDRVGMPVLDPEQYLIADETCVLDVSRAERELGWKPAYSDSDMLIAAYKEYRRGQAGTAAPTGSGLAAANAERGGQ